MLFALLTANEHDTDGEDLLWVGVWWDVPKPHAGQTAEGEVQGRNVLVLDGGAGGLVTVVVLFTDLLSQVVQPANLHASDASRARALHVADGVPDAGQPVSDEGEGAHEQEEDGSSIFWVTVQLSGHSYQPQQPGCFQ